MYSSRVSQYLAFHMNLSHNFSIYHHSWSLVLQYFLSLYLSPRRLIGHWHPGPGALSTGPRVSALYKCTPGAIPALSCTVTGTVQVYTTPTHVAPMSWGGMPGGDVFEFIINCMSLLNIAHARHCPHRSRWLPWPGARIIATKTVTRAGDAEPTLIQNTKSGMKVYLASVVAAFVSVVGNIYLWCQHGDNTWQPPGSDTDKPDKTRINYTLWHLCGRFWRGSG